MLRFSGSASNAEAGVSASSGRAANSWCFKHFETLHEQAEFGQLGRSLGISHLFRFFFVKLKDSLCQTKDSRDMFALSAATEHDSLGHSVIPSYSYSIMLLYAVILFLTESYCHICHTLVINDSLNQTPCLSPTILGRLHWPLASLLIYSRMRSRLFQAVPCCFAIGWRNIFFVSCTSRPNMITFYNFYNFYSSIFTYVHIS